MAEYRIYADNAATTAVSDVAYNAMLPYFKESYGNPSATHSYGTDAKRAVEEARKTIADALGARVNEIFFTSGGTESDNWAIKSAVDLRGKKGKHIITTEIEHNAVYKTVKQLEKDGYDATFLSVDKHGQVTAEQLEAAIRPDTTLITIMMANNEIGTIQPITALYMVAKKHGILFHTDAIQAVGHIPVDVCELGIDMLSVSSHKFHGPKGVGILYVNLKTVLPPLLIGGGQEKGRRSGTSNVPGIVGMAAALKDAAAHMDENERIIMRLRDRLITEILKIPGALLTGHPVHRLPGLASFVFEGIEGEPLVAALNEAGICASSGSACSAESGEPSRMMKAIGIAGSHKTAPLRLSLCRYNTVQEIDSIISVLPEALKKAAAYKVVAQNIDLDDY
jgi:cysteine desulfurase